MYIYSDGHPDAVSRISNEMIEAVNIPIRYLSTGLALESGLKANNAINKFFSFQLLLFNRKKYVCLFVYLHIYVRSKQTGRYSDAPDISYQISYQITYLCCSKPGGAIPAALIARRILPPRHY